MSRMTIVISGKCYISTIYYDDGMVCDIVWSYYKPNYPVKPGEQLVKYEPVPTWVRLLIMLHWEKEVWRASMGYKSVSPFQNEDGSLNMDALMMGIPKDYVWRDPRHPKPKSVSIFDRIFPLENKQL